MRALSAPSRLWRAESGLAAIEFAAILPVMVIAWLGMAQLFQILQAANRAAQTAQVAAELQADSFSPIAFADLVAAASQMVAPLPSGPTVLSIDLVSVLFDAGGKASQGWRCTSGSNIDTVVPLALSNNVASPGQSVIMVTVKYSYTPTITASIFGQQTFVERSFSRPRDGRPMARPC